MASCVLRRAAMACAVCAAPSLGGPVLDFEATNFRAELAYNAGQGSSSQPPVDPNGQALTFVDDNQPWDNLLTNPNDQIWGVATRQTPDSPGAEIVSLEFEFWNLAASSIQANSPVIIALEALNSTGNDRLAILGAPTLRFEIGTTWVGPFDLSNDAWWEWGATSNRSVDDGEYDLVINLANQPPSLLFEGVDPNDLIDKVWVKFDVTVPEPGTFALLAAAGLFWRRRRR